MSKTLWSWADMGLDIAKMVIGKTNPIVGGAIAIIDAVVEKKADGVSNKSVMKMLEHSAKSTWNNLDEDKLARISDILFEKKELDEDVRQAKIFEDEENYNNSHHVTTDEFYKARKGN